MVWFLGQCLSKLSVPIEFIQSQALFVAGPSTVIILFDAGPSFKILLVTVLSLSFIGII